MSGESKNTRELLVATGNPGKFKEMASILSGVNFKLLSIKDLLKRGFVEDDFEGFSEDGKTFKENAFKKAEFYSGKTGMLTLAEDSGILVDALPGELGVYTRRFGPGETVTDEEWLEYFMERMKDVPPEKRGAKFVCWACLLDPHNNLVEYFEGETSGRIADKVLIDVWPGLPLSSVFIPDGFEKAYAELGHEEKNKVSHRGKAMGKVRQFLFDKKTSV